MEVARPRGIAARRDRRHANPAVQPCGGPGEGHRQLHTEPGERVQLAAAMGIDVLMGDDERPHAGKLTGGAGRCEAGGGRGLHGESGFTRLLEGFGDSIVSWTSRPWREDEVTLPRLSGAVAGSTLILQALYASACADNGGTGPREGSVRLVQLSAGSLHTCGLTDTGQAFCWGINSHGELGDGTRSDRSLPTPVSGGLSFVKISSGDGDTCGLIESGAAYCWGTNSVGELGDGTREARTSPTPVAGGLRFVGISAGVDHTCALAQGGTAYCWGDNYFGSLGDGTNSARLVPGPVTGGVTFVEISGSSFSTCGRTESGSVDCWGLNDAGQLGDGTTTNRTTPTPIATDTRFVEISSGDAFGCGRTEPGAVYCWGYYGGGTFRSVPLQKVPALVATGVSFSEISVGGYYMCGRSDSAAAWCWGGDNAFGQVGDGTMIIRPEPTPVAGTLSFVDITAGWSHACGRTQDDKVYCWGGNFHGELGDGTTTGRLVPTLVLLP